MSHGTPYDLEHHLWLKYSEKFLRLWICGKKPVASAADLGHAGGNIKLLKAVSPSALGHGAVIETAAIQTFLSKIFKTVGKGEII